MRTEVSQDHIDALGPELRQILSGELAAGNWVVETRSASPSSVFVRLAKPFHVSLLRHFPAVHYREFKYPLSWNAHYQDEARQQILASGVT
jgi:hypothetical protein